LTNKKSENDLYEFLEYQLPIFDELLAEAQMPLSKRPLAAACRLVNYCIIKIEGDNKDKYLEKEWFRSIYKMIRKWYRERYADAMDYNNDDFALGAVLIYDTPFRLEIPLSIAQEKEGECKRWFCLPNSVLPEENVLDWLTKKPNFQTMSKHELECLKQEISRISSFVRRIRVSLMSATIKKEELHKMSSSIPAHIDNSVRDILSLYNGRISTSFWEIHLAVEKTLKLLILQNGLDHNNEHNLKTLCAIANTINGIVLESSMFEKLPSSGEAIRQRYGEGISFTIQQAVENYILGIEIIAKLTELLAREFVLKNARLLIALPPWEK
jgi:hypothetical protein